MFKYTISFEDSDCDNSISFYHEKDFSKEQFQEICEDAILYSFKMEKWKNKIFFVSSMSDEFIIEYFLHLNFKMEEYICSHQSYSFDGLSNLNNVKNKELLNFIKKEYEEHSKH